MESQQAAWKIHTIHRDEKPASSMKNSEKELVDLDKYKSIPIVHLPDLWYAYSNS